MGNATGLSLIILLIILSSCDIELVFGFNPILNVNVIFFCMYFHICWK